MGKKKERKGKSIVWFGPDDEHFTGVHFKGIKESVKGLPPNYGKGPIDHGGKKDSQTSFDPFDHDTGPYPDLFGKKTTKTKKKKKKK